MIQVTLRLKVSGAWYSDIFAKFETPIKILECKNQRGTDGCSNLIEIMDSKDQLGEIITELNQHPHVTDVDFSPSRKGFAIGAIKTNQCYSCAALHNTDCFLTSYTIVNKDEAEWKLITPTEKSVVKLIDRLKKDGMEVKLISKVHLDPDMLLTARQEKIMNVAYKRGYFDYPKRINIRELARIFEVSISTMSEILRKGEKKIIGKYFKDA